MVYLSASQIKDQLESSGIYDARGSVMMELNGTTVQIKTTDTMGNNIQEWLNQWFEENDIYHRLPRNTQNFPDFYLANETFTGLLEVKSFFASRSPAFDVANFDSYWQSLRMSPFRLDADYLIFAYDLVEGSLMVRQLYLKKVWQMTGPARDFPLKCQIKNGQIYNIRPNSFNSERTVFRSFSSKEEFLVAIYRTLLSTTHRAGETRGWLQQVINGYNDFSGQDMSDEISRLLV